MKADTIRLYTKQNAKTLLMLERDGRIINNRIYVQLHFGDMAQHYLGCYDWFASEAAKRVPRPADVTLPIWCAVSPETCLLPEEGSVIYIVDMPLSEVVFFDDAKWEHVLNHHYVPTDAADYKAYCKHLEDIGVQGSFEFFEGRYAGKYPKEERIIKSSWPRIFDVADIRSPGVCANIWEIRSERIVRTVKPGESVFDEFAN